MILTWDATSNSWVAQANDGVDDVMSATNESKWIYLQQYVDLMIQLTNKQCNDTY